VQQQLHQPLPPAAIGRHAAAAAPALLPLPGHLPGCPPGQRPHHQRRSLRPPPAHPHVLLPAQPGPQRPGLHLHHCPQSHAQFPLGHQEHLLQRMCCSGFFFMFFMSAEFYLLTVMCYDRYVSICKPLHYWTLLGSRACAHMAVWASGFLNSLLHAANTFSLPLCQGNALGQFFCETPQIIKLSCSHSYLRELGLLAVTVCLVLGCFVFIVYSYVQIFRAVLRIPSEQGQHKAFSTCLPHLAVVSLFVSTGFSAHLKPPSISSPSLDLAVSVLYSVVPPALNPLIYSLRNQELKAVVWKLKIGFQKH
ncbi:hypothetical protein Nmel_008611, partial [Mimus melanotis]